MEKACSYISSVIIVMSLLLISEVSSYPAGAPRGACRSGLPVHSENGTRYRPQETPSPYQISVNVSDFKPGDTVTVTISSDQGLGFRGMFVQMRNVKIEGFEEHYRDKPEGKFHKFDANARPLTCDVSLESVTHKDPYVKYNQILYWKSPLLIKTNVVVRATILTNFSTYWTKIESPVIKLIREKTLPAESLGKPWVKEILKNKAAEGDKEATRNLVRARFEKGFENMLDPNGFIMVHYVLDVLPFEVSYPGKSTQGVKVTFTPPNNSTSMITSTATPVITSANMTTDTETVNKTTENITVTTTMSNVNATNDTAIANKTAENLAVSTPLPNITADSTNSTSSKLANSTNSTSSKLGALSKGTFETDNNVSVGKGVATTEADKLYFEALVTGLLRGDTSVVNELRTIVGLDDNTLDSGEKDENLKV